MSCRTVRACVRPHIVALPSGASAYLGNNRRGFPGYFREDELILWTKYQLLVELRELSNAYECEHDTVPRGYDPVNQ